MFRKLLLSVAVIGLLAFVDASSAEARGCRGGGYYGGYHRTSYHHGGRHYYHGGPSYYHRSYRHYPSFYGGHYGGYRQGISFSFGF